MDGPHSDRPERGLRLFGLTGGVASGKSTVAARFRACQVPVIDADDVARQVVAPGTEGLDEVLAAFGVELRRPDGALDRARLAERVFADGAARQRLNAILHPRIRAEADRQAEALAVRGVELCCYEAALLVESGLADRYRPLVVAVAPVELQIARLMQRDGLDERAARQRIAAQLPLAEKIAVADFVVDTSGSLAETASRADDALAAVRARLDR